jgi:hypothetical protein
MLSAPAGGLGEEKLEPCLLDPGGARVDRALCTRLCGDEVVSLERLERGPRVEGSGTCMQASTLEVLAEQHRLVLPGTIEPLTREPVPKRLIFGRQHLISRVAHDRMPERVLLVGRKPRRVPLLHDLAAVQLVEPIVDLARLVLAARERQDTTSPEQLSEDARCSQDSARHRVEPLKPCLDHRENRGGERPCLVGPEVRR